MLFSKSVDVHHLLYHCDRLPWPPFGCCNGVMVHPGAWNMPRTDFWGPRWSRGGTGACQWRRQWWCCLSMPSASPLGLKWSYWGVGNTMHPTRDSSRTHCLQRPSGRWFMQSTRFPRWARYWYRLSPLWWSSATKLWRIATASLTLNLACNSRIGSPNPGWQAATWSRDSSFSSEGRAHDLEQYTGSPATRS